MTPSSFSFSANPSSTAIKGISYIEEGGSLVLIMDSGYVLHYTGVPKAKAIGLISAESVGEYYNREIRNKCPYLRVGQQEHPEMPVEKPAPGTDLGSRNSTLQQIATDMAGQRAAPEAIRRALQERNNEFQAPLPQDEVESILKRALKK